MRTAVLISAALVGARELIAELGADPEALAHEAGLPLRYLTSRTSSSRPST